MSNTVGIDIKVGSKQLQDAAKSAETLKKNLKDLSKAEHSINIKEARTGSFSDAAFGQRSGSRMEFERQNRILRESLREVAGVNRSTWRERYRITPPDERQPPGSGGRGGLLNWGRLGKAGLALGGISAGVGFLLNGRRNYQELTSIEAILATRGAGYDRNASPYGYGPMQEAEIALALNKSSGYLGNNASRIAQRFARATGTDMTAGVGFMGQMYGMTGASADKQGRLMDVLVSLKENSKDKRTEEILKLINSNLTTIFRAQGNKDLSDSQIAGVMATTMGMYNKAGSMGNSPELFNTMQGALKLGGGDTVGDLMRWKIMGGDNGPMTAGKLLEMQRRQQMGLLDPAMRAGANRIIRGSRSRDEANILIQRLLPGSIENPANQQIADMYIDLFGPGGKLTGRNDPRNQSKTIRSYISGKKLSPAIQLEAEKLLGVYSQTPGARIQQRTATRENMMVGVGEDLEQAFGEWEDFTTSSFASILKSGLIKDTAKFLGDQSKDVVGGIRGNRMDPIFEKFGLKFGIKPSTLKAIANIETGGTFKYDARSPKGALGLMQLMPSTAKDMGVVDPFNPVQSIEGGAKYFQSLLNRYGGDENKALAAYNWGPGNLDKYGLSRMPQETRAYLSKVRGAQQQYSAPGTLLDVPTGSQEYKDAELFGLGGLLRQAMEYLGRIAENTSHAPQQPQTVTGGPK